MGGIKHVDLCDVLEEEWAESVGVLDLKIKPSFCFKDLKWHCKEGICESSMKKLNEEFNLFRGLFPLKIYI